LAARMKEKYQSEVFTAMMDQFKYENVMDVPKLEKITLNIGLGEAKENAKLMEGAVEELGLISGQRPVVTTAKNPSQTSKSDKACP
jgi:large subunit ribosomal protein L5